MVGQRELWMPDTQKCESTDYAHDGTVGGTGEDEGQALLPLLRL